jgi:DNA-binding NarL/FixJ family response regulator
VTPPIRVLVADDHPLFRQGLGALLRDSPETELVAEASDGADVAALVGETRPDVVVMDINMPGVDGVEATRRLTRTHPTVAVVMLTMMDDDAAVFSAMRAGARGYVLKGAAPEEILRAVVAVADGQAIFGTALARRLEQYFAGAAERTELMPFPDLTPREREILRLLARGESNQAIATQLGVSEKTVRNNVSNVFTKLRVTDRAAAVARARDAGIGEL